VDYQVVGTYRGQRKKCNFKKKIFQDSEPSFDVLRRNCNTRFRRWVIYAHLTPPSIGAVSFAESTCVSVACGLDLVLLLGKPDYCLVDANKNAYVRACALQSTFHGKWTFQRSSARAVYYHAVIDRRVPVACNGRSEEQSLPVQTCASDPRTRLIQNPEGQYQIAALIVRHPLNLFYSCFVGLDTGSEFCFETVDLSQCIV
jgi:hypothetical protein